MRFRGPAEGFVLAVVLTQLLLDRLIFFSGKQLGHDCNDDNTNDESRRKKQRRISLVWGMSQDAHGARSQSYPLPRHNARSCLTSSKSTGPRNTSSSSSANISARHEHENREFQNQRRRNEATAPKEMKVHCTRADLKRRREEILRDVVCLEVATERNVWLGSTVESTTTTATTMEGFPPTTPRRRIIARYVESGGSGGGGGAPLCRKNERDKTNKRIHKSERKSRHNRQEDISPHRGTTAHHHHQGFAGPGSNAGEISRWRPSPSPGSRSATNKRETTTLPQQRSTAIQSGRPSLSLPPQTLQPAIWGQDRHPTERRERRPRPAPGLGWPPGEVLGAGGTLGVMATFGGPRHLRAFADPSRRDVMGAPRGAHVGNVTRPALWGGTGALLHRRAAAAAVATTAVGPVASMTSARAMGLGMGTLSIPVALAHSGTSGSSMGGSGTLAVGANRGDGRWVGSCGVGTLAVL